MGLDPGFANLGVAVVERTGNSLKLLHHALVTTKPKQSDAEREAIIWRALSGPIRQFHPLVFGMENQLQVATAARMRALKKKPGQKTAGFNASNDKVILVTGIAKGACLAYGVRYELFQPATIKNSVCGPGSGRADKDQIKTAVRVLFPELRDVNLSEHVADAIATAVLSCRVAVSGISA